MTRTQTIALALAAVAAAAPAALADSQPIDTGRLASADLNLSLPGGDRLSLGLRAVAGRAGDRLLVSTARCAGDSCTTGEAAGPLPDGALTIDPSTADATLHMDLDGRPLAVTWHHTDQSTVLVGGIEGGGNDGSLEASTYEGAPAAVVIDYLGERCRSTGGVGDALLVDTGAATGSAAAKTLHELHVPEGATLRC